MKRLLKVFLACTFLAFSLTACSGGGQESETAAETQMTVTEAVTEEMTAAAEAAAMTEESAAETETAAMTEETAAGTETAAMTEESAIETEIAGTGAATDAAAAESTAGDDNILIAYFSWSGNTEALAEMIQSEVGGDLFRIETAEPYTDDYDALLDIAQAEQQEGARPQLSGQVENWDSYDVIFVGYPNWWSDAPMAVYTFLESYDFTGKTLIPFNTSASGGFGRSLSGVEESAPGAAILDGFTVTGDNVENAAGDVSAWISGLGL